MIFSSSRSNQNITLGVGPDFLNARTNGKHYDQFDAPDDGCSGDCNDCPVMDCDNNSAGEPSSD